MSISPCTTGAGPGVDALSASLFLGSESPHPIRIDGTAPHPDARAIRVNPCQRPTEMLREVAESCDLAASPSGRRPRLGSGPARRVRASRSRFGCRRTSWRGAGTPSAVETRVGVYDKNRVVSRRSDPVHDGRGSIRGCVRSQSRGAETEGTGLVDERKRAESASPAGVGSAVGARCSSSRRPGEPPSTSSEMFRILPISPGPAESKGDRQTGVERSIVSSIEWVTPIGKLGLGREPSGEAACLVLVSQGLEPARV
jgi:hypothetical protein